MDRTVPLELWRWPTDLIWGVCSALLGRWFFVGNYFVIQGERRIEPKMA